MTIAFSTSSPIASVALFDAHGTLLAHASGEAKRAASTVCLNLLENLLAQQGLEVQDAELFAADLGPGSFTGVRVGVALAQSMALALGKPVCGADAFQLIAAHGRCFVPSRKGEFLLRKPGLPPETVQGIPEEALGYGPGVKAPVFPSAARFSELLPGLATLAPHQLQPGYLVGPRISQPKRPYGIGGDGA